MKRISQADNSTALKNTRFVHSKSLKRELIRSGVVFQWDLNYYYNRLFTSEAQDWAEAVTAEC